MEFKIEKIAEVTSTNSLALERAANGEKEGLVLVANFQTQGRGKPGNEWISPAGKNLLFSLLLRPPVAPNGASYLTQLSCRSIAAVLKSSFNINSTIKRPNDILVNGKKICGILVESSSTSQKSLDYAVVGVGLNVNATGQDLYPSSTSIQELNGICVNLDELLNQILKQFATDIGKLYVSSS